MVIAQRSLEVDKKLDVTQFLKGNSSSWLRARITGSGIIITISDEEGIRAERNIGKQPEVFVFTRAKPLLDSMKDQAIESGMEENFDIGGDSDRQLRLMPKKAEGLQQMEEAIMVWMDLLR